ncbi:alpha/beta fold hydrolase [Micromonospora zhanjiangensis]
MTTFVLVPGAGGAAWYWHRLVPELRGRGHDALAVDLPADDDTAGLTEYADTVVQAVGDRTDLVLVASSMGAYTAPLVAERLPTRMIVLVNAMIPTAGESAGEWWANTGHEQARREKAERDGRTIGADDDLADAFIHDLPPDLVAESVRHARDQSGTPFQKPWPLPAWPEVPTRVLAGRDDRFFPVEFQRRVARWRLGIVPDEMPGGHLVALSRPAELADRLVDYLRTVP